MTELQRIDLSASHMVQLAAAAVGRQGERGAVSALAREHQVARGTVYAVRTAAQELLTQYFSPPEPPSSEPTPSTVTVQVGPEHLRRAVTALRVMVPGTLRPIVELLPILFPGVRLSYGSVQRLAVEAEQQAAAFNAKEDLSAISVGALDELFSQGQPVLGGIALDSGYVFCLALRQSRGEADWREVLTAARNQGLELDSVVKDAAQGIAAGVRAVFPECHQHDDCFHAKYEAGKVQRILERRAYAALAREEEARQGLAAAEPGSNTQSWRKRLWWAEAKCAEALELHDTFERAAKQVEEALEFVDLETGELRTRAAAQAQLEQATQVLLSLSEPKAVKVGRYLRNRIPGLLGASLDLEEQLQRLAQNHGPAAAGLAARMVRLLRMLGQPRYRWQHADHFRLLLASYAKLQALLPAQADALVRLVQHCVECRHRASSAIEGFNAALRPHLYLQRGVTQGFLELFRAYFNLRNRRSGPYQDLSPYERLTGVPVTDWLTMIGLPPTPPN